MLKKIWQKISKNHLLLMVICCLVPIVLVFIILPLFRGGSNGWIWLIILLCPLSHLLMMGGHKHDGDKCEKEDKKNKK